jgi:hypothetical protein
VEVDADSESEESESVVLLDSNLTCSRLVLRAEPPIRLGLPPKMLFLALALDLLSTLGLELADMLGLELDFGAPNLCFPCFLEIAG